MMTMTTMKPSYRNAVFPVIASTLIGLGAVALAQEIGDYTWNFDGCDPGEYYGNLLQSNTDESQWDRDELQKLLLETHRNVLPYTREGEPGLDDGWAALMDVDQGSIPGTVSLLYTNNQMEAIPFGQRSWVKEQIWPLDRGIGLEGPDLSDVHNARPTTVLSDVVRGDSFFGECGVLVKDVNSCQQPAEGAAEDTCNCDGRSGLFTPPADKKGDIARALLYMDLRYDGNELFTLDLRLTDCPFQPESDMAYLSQMIQWHLDDPPSPEEVARNDQICRHWQGNRNPFVDFPDLAVGLHYEPLALPAVGERKIYEACEKIPTQAPTMERNHCDRLSPGDVYVWLLNSDEPDTVGLYSFVTMPGGFELYMTDNPWNGTQFLEQGGNDGTLLFTVPEGGLTGGTAWGYNDPALSLSGDEYWTEIQGDFSLNNDDGEAVFLYCLNGEGEQKPLLTFSYGATLAAAGQEVYAENESNFPESLGEIGLQNIVPHYKNFIFNATSDSQVANDELKVAVRDPANWIGSNISRFGVEGSRQSASPMIDSMWRVVFCATLASIMVMV